VTLEAVLFGEMGGRAGEGEKVVRELLKKINSCIINWGG